MGPKEYANASKMFMSFARSVAGAVTQNAGTAQYTGDMEIDAFVEKWGLDSISQEQLLKLDADTKRRVITGFAPPDYSKANKMFMGFLKSVANTSAAYATGNVGGVSSYGQSPNFTGDMSIDAFVATHDLDSIAQEHLLQLPPDVQQRVMQDFKPTDKSKASRIFMGFVRNVRAGQGGAPQGGGAPSSQQAFNGGQNWGQGQSYGESPRYTGDQQLDAFVSQWGLDSKAQSVLLSMDQQTQQRVMREFAPPNAENCSRAFMGFAKTVQNSPQRTDYGSYGGGGYGGYGGGSGGYDGGYSGGGGGGGFNNGEMAPPTGDAELDAFVAKWGLDGKAQESLAQLSLHDPDSLSRVMADFNPPDISRASRMLMAFVKGVTSGGSGKGKGKDRFSPY